MSAEHLLDARNLLCPLPVIRVQNRIRGLGGGEVLKVTCTDPGALSDIPAWCRINGHTILATEEGEREFVITIQVGKE